MNQEQIFESIVRHRALIRRQVTRTIRKCRVDLPSDGLDDLVSDVVIELAAKRLRSWREGGGRSLKGWIAMAADCAAQNVLKKYRYTDVYNMTDADADEGISYGLTVAGDQSGVVARATALRETGRLRAALTELAPLDRELVEAMATGAERDYADLHSLTPVQMTRTKQRVRTLLSTMLER